MPITTVLFDLDGTLLPMDQEVFVRTYLSLLAKKMAPLGYDPQRLTEAIWKGTAAVVKTTASKPTSRCSGRCSGRSSARR